MPTDPTRVQAVFLAAVELNDPAARSAFVEEQCGGDTDLRERVGALLRAHDNPDSLLDVPAVPVVSTPDPDSAPTRAFHNPRIDPGDGPTRTQGEESEDTADALGFLEPPQRPDSIGRIGHYEVLEVLGRGGFGIVFRAFDDVLQRVVAVKVLAPSMAATSPARKRFIREAQSSAKVQHENVVRVHAVEDQPLPYLVMEFVSGETLQQRLDRTGPLETAEAIRIARQIAEGLAAAHEQGLIHRDIKPSNILIERGPQEKAKITDFGLARAADDASLTRSGVVAGTPMYMAPEQAKGEALDHRADLFSLGSVLYAMLTGRPPFRAETALAVLKRVTEDTPRPIREVIPEVPEWLCRIVEKLHAKNPAERFQTAREVADLLTDCEKQLQTHKEVKDFSRIPGGKPAPRGRFGRRWKRAAAVIVLVLAVAGGVYAAPFALRYANDEGKVTLVNEEVKVLVRRDGQIVATLDPANPSAHLASGEYELEAVCKEGEEAGGFVFGTRRLFERGPGLGASGPVCKFTIRRGDAIRVGVFVQDRTVSPPSPKPDPDGWVQLFNGTDLTGWKTHPKQPGEWKVKDGELVSSGPRSHLFSERADYQNFHLRVEASVNDGGLGLVYYGVPKVALRFDDMERTWTDEGKLDEAEHGAPSDTAVTLNCTHQSRWSIGRTGSLTGVANTNRMTHKPDEWFVLDVIVNGTDCTIRVNGETVNELKGRDFPFRRGHIVLGTTGRNTSLRFRKIEIKELPPESPVAPPRASAPFDAAKAKEHQDAWAKYLGTPVEYENTLGMKFRLIPPCEFTMGSSADEIKWLLENSPEYKNGPDWLQDTVRSEGPARRVTLREPFYLGTWEVTVGQFREFVKATGYKTEAERTGGGRVWSIQKGTWEQKTEYTWDNPVLSKSDSHPVFQMALADARAFCAWLSEKEGRQYAIPTEEQWEYAARAGTTTRWPSGDDPASVKGYGWVSFNSEGKPRPVGRLAANSFGLFDMCGNAAEITLDAQGRLVDRGGSAGDDVWRSRSAKREVKVEKPWDGPSSGRGFRVAIVGDLKQKSPPLAVAPFDAANAKQHQDVWAKHLGAPVEIENSVGMKLRLIPPGRSGGAEVGKPFYLGTFEVTQAQYERITGKNPSYFNAQRGGGPDHPAELMTPEQARDLGRLLSELPAEKAAGRVYRLPTYAEWYWGAQAGSTGSYCFGDSVEELGKFAWYKDNSDARTHPVGKKLPNAWGLYDVHGNVSEYCTDALGLMGGSIAHAAPGMTSATKFTSKAGVPVRFDGVRLVLEVAPSAEPWVQLFNGTDLTGWNTSAAPGWKVDGGLLVAKTAAGQLATARSYKDFYLKVRAKYTGGGANVTCRYTSRIVRAEAVVSSAIVYISDAPGELKTGAVMLTSENKQSYGHVRKQLAPPGEWFTLEIVARGNHVQTFVNGEKTADLIDPAPGGTAPIRFGVGPGCEIQYQKIEIKELPPMAETQLDVIRGWDLVARAQYDDARKYFAQALGREPNHAEAHAGMGCVAAAQKNTVEAERHALRALLHGGGDYLILHNVACIYAMCSVTDPNQETKYQDLALDQLRRGVELWNKTKQGPDPIKLIQAESWFPKSMRDKPDFKALLNPSAPPVSDKQRLQGAWVAESAERNGEAVPKEQAAQIRVQFDGGNVRITMPGGKADEGTFKLDTEVNPKQIDCSSAADQKTRYGIYRFLDEDRLEICMGEKNERPKAFDSKGDDPTRMRITLKRAPAEPKKPEPPAKKDEPNPAVPALKDAVAAKTRAVDDAKKRFDAGTINKIELLAIEAELTEARIKLAEAERKPDAVAAHLETLVKQRQEERDLIKLRVEVGTDRAAVLDAADARLADAKARLAKLKP